jgi:transketolase C-terminal domain/subunit
MSTKKSSVSKAQTLTQEHDGYIGRLKSEPKVPVRVDEIYAQYIGKEFTYLLNGEPVTLIADGKTRNYPVSVAENINQKLNDIARANKEVKQNSKIFG